MQLQPVLAATALLALAGATHAAPPRFILRDLGVFGVNTAGQQLGGVATAHYINNRGYAIGTIRRGGFGLDDWTNAAWDGGPAIDVTPNFPGNVLFPVVRSLNDSGSSIISQPIEGSGSLASWPHIIDPGQAPKPNFVAPIPDAIPGFSVGVAINNRGQIAGSAQYFPPPGLPGTYVDVVRWEADRQSFTILGRTGGAAQPEDINELGQIAGSGYTNRQNTSELIPFVTRNDVIVNLNLNVTDLPSGAANDINNNGQAVGAVWIVSSQRFPAYWNQNNQRTLLPLLEPSFEGYAWALNDAGWIVGHANGGSNETSGAMLWIDGQPYRLQDLVQGGLTDGWESLDYAYSINERGQIVGSGRRIVQTNPMVFGDIRAFILTPACPADLTATALPNTPGYAAPDGTLNNDDFFFFLARFAAGDLTRADLTNTAIPSQPGYGRPNGAITNDDFFYYLSIFSAGC